MWMLKGWGVCFVLSVFVCTVARCRGFGERHEAEDARKAFLGSLTHEQKVSLAIEEGRDKREADLRRRAEKDPRLAEKLRFPGLEASASALPVRFPKARQTSRYALNKIFETGFLFPLSEKEAVVSFLKEFSGEAPRVAADGWIFFDDVRESHVCIREVADPDVGLPVLLVEYTFPVRDPSGLK